MRIISIVFSIFLMHIASVVWSGTSIPCSPNLEVSWVFDKQNNKSQLYENTDDLSKINVYLDTGFLKIPATQDKETALFRQHLIIQNSEDPLDVTVRYESTNAVNIDQTSIIMSDPMCTNSINVLVNIFTTAEFAYRNINYSCNCLSSIHDSKHLIYN